MDQRLSERLQKWFDQIKVVESAERVFRALESQEKPLYAQLFLSSMGKTVTERESVAYVHTDWRDFQSGLVEARAAYNRERSILELKQASFNSEYLSSKMDGEAIMKMPRSIT